MADKGPEATDGQPSLTLSDDQIVTERVFPRRSFVTAASAFLIGAGALVCGVQAQGQTSDPDHKKPTKGSDPDHKKAPKGTDPDHKKKPEPDRSDPDHKK
ncbi:MAG: hypothetical protein ACRD34_01165 [Bryobacteraceae bacterium]